MERQGAEPEFSCPFVVAELPVRATARKLAADPAERAALRARFGIAALHSLTADLAIEPAGADARAVKVKGALRAVVEQVCVVTLRPFEQTVAQSFELVFAPGAAPGAAGEVVVSPFDDDGPEPLVGDSIDLGELVAEQLSVALDAYPRHPEAPAGVFEYATGEADAREAPFAALGQLKGKL